MRLKFKKHSGQGVIAQRQQSQILTYYKKLNAAQT
jgi:hypothetical protein